MEGKVRKSGFKRPLFGFSILMILGLALAACTPAASPIQAPAPTATTVAVAPTAAVPVTGGEASLSVMSDAKLGSILVGNNGMTVYAFTKDTPNQSNCTGQCIKNWPALATQGSPKAGAGVDASLIGNIALADGTKVVTYNKMPLYFFYKDSKPGDVNGQGVGSVWFTVAPDGKLVGQEASSGTPAGTDEAPAPAAAEATVNVATDPKLGKILVDGKGLTLYMFGKDTPDQSNCSGGCLKAWPALASQGSPKAGDGVDASKLGTAKLADGSLIVTYNHMPLYYFIQDKSPGDVKGQGNGNIWYVVGPDGKPVGMETSSATAAPAASAAEAVINVATDPKLGKILVGANGMTLYIFEKDNPDKSNCQAGCLQAWPPLLTQGSPKLGDGVNQALVGTATLPDGTKIVTYNHMPLYYFAKDNKAGDVTGQNVGSVWYVVSPDGKAVDQ